MRLIDTDALTRKIQFLIRIRQRSIFDALDEIDSAPTINPESLSPQGEVANAIEHAPACDVVEVVRCKDCKHMSRLTNMLHCAVWAMYHGMGDDGFCGYGERKED